MIINRNIQKIACQLHFSGKINILLTWFKVAGWMVMRQNNRGGMVLQSGIEYDFWIGDGAGLSAFADQMLRNNTV